jgi:hypothetical protein
MTRRLDARQAAAADDGELERHDLDRGLGVVVAKLLRGM